MSMELFKSMSGIDIQHVPYKGSSPALTDLVAGQVVAFIGNMPPTVPLIKAGKLRALAVTTKSRSALMPELPTIAEAGLARLRDRRMVRRAGAGRHAAGDRQSAVRGDRKIARSPEMRERLVAMGAEPVGGTPEEFKAVIDRDIAKWKPLGAEGRHQDRLSLHDASLRSTRSSSTFRRRRTGRSSRVTTQDGATGWGECSLNGWEPLLVAQAQMLAREAAGRELEDALDALRSVRAAHSPAGSSRTRCEARSSRRSPISARRPR